MAHAHTATGVERRIARCTLHFAIRHAAGRIDVIRVARAERALDRVPDEGRSRCGRALPSLNSDRAAGGPQLGGEVERRGTARLDTERARPRAHHRLNEARRRAACSEEATGERLRAEPEEKDRVQIPNALGTCGRASLRSATLGLAGEISWRLAWQPTAVENARGDRVQEAVIKEWK